MLLGVGWEGEGDGGWVWWAGKGGWLEWVGPSRLLVGDGGEGRGVTTRGYSGPGTLHFLNRGVLDPPFFGLWKQD